MIAERLSTLRPSLRATLRSTRPAGRRGYARASPSRPSLQERLGQTSDRPWQMAAVAVAIPGMMYLRKGNTPKTSPGESRLLHTESVNKGPKAEAKTEPTARAKMEEGIRRTQNAGSETEGTSIKSSRAA